MDRDLCAQRVMIFLISSFISLVGGEVPRCSLSDFVMSLTFLNIYSSVRIKYYTINDFKRSVKHTHYISPASGVSRAFSILNILFDPYDLRQVGQPDSEKCGRVTQLAASSSAPYSERLVSP